MTKKLKVCIIGAENWSSAIATAVGANVIENDRFDERVHQYVYDELVSSSTLSEVINETHENIKYLPGIHMPVNLIAINDLVEAAENADILIFATPQHFIKSYCNILAGIIKPDAIAVSLVKGLQNIRDGKLELYSQSISRNLNIPCYSMVCANCAMEMAQGKLCEITIGCNNEEHANLLQEIFQTDNCQVVIINDVDGVELFGTLKDIIALGAGLVDGLRLGENARVAVLHLGLKEMMRFVKDFYPSSKLSTFFESCGVADLVTSCHGDKHVNFAKAFVTTGKTIQELESNLMNGRKLLGPQVAEEVYSFLSKAKMDNQYPLFTSIHKICRNEQPPETIVDSLRNHPDLHNNTISALLDKEHSAMKQKQTQPRVFESQYVKDQPAIGLNMSSKDQHIYETTKQEQIESYISKNVDTQPFHVSSGEHVNVATANLDNNFLESLEPTKVTIWLKGVPDFNETIIEVKNNNEELISEMPIPMSTDTQRTVSVELIEPIDFAEDRISGGDEQEEKNNMNFMFNSDNMQDMQEKIDSLIIARDEQVLDDDKIRRAAQTAKQQIGFKSKRWDEQENNKNISKEDDWIADNEWRPEYKITEKEKPDEMNNSERIEKDDWLADNEWREEYEIIRKDPKEENLKENNPEQSYLADERTTSPTKILELSELSDKELLFDLKFNENLPQFEPLLDQERSKFSQESTELNDTDNIVEYKQRVHASLAQGSGSDNADNLVIYSDDDAHTLSLLQDKETASGKVPNQNTSTTSNPSIRTPTGVANFSSSSYKDPNFPDKSKTKVPNENNDAASENEKLIDYLRNESNMASDQFATLKGFDDFEKNWLNNKELNRNKNINSKMSTQYSEEDLINIFKTIRDNNDGLESDIAASDTNDVRNSLDSEWDWLRVSSKNEHIDSNIQSEITGEVYQDPNYLEEGTQRKNIALSQEQDITNREEQDLPLGSYTTNEFQDDAHIQPHADERYNQFEKRNQQDFTGELDDNRLSPSLHSDIKNNMTIDDYIRLSEYEHPKQAAYSVPVDGQQDNKDNIHDERFEIASEYNTDDHTVKPKYMEYKQDAFNTHSQEQNDITDTLSDEHDFQRISHLRDFKEKQDAGQQVTFDVKDSMKDFMETPHNEEQHHFVIDSIEIEQEEPLEGESAPTSELEQTEIMSQEAIKSMYETHDNVHELGARDNVEEMKFESPDNAFAYLDNIKDLTKSEFYPLTVEGVLTKEGTEFQYESQAQFDQDSQLSDKQTSLRLKKHNTAEDETAQFTLEDQYEPQAQYFQDSRLADKQTLHEFAEPSLRLKQHNTAEDETAQFTLEKHLSKIKDSLTLEERLHNVEILTSSLVANKQQEKNKTYAEAEGESTLNLKQHLSNEDEHTAFDKQSLFHTPESYYSALEKEPTSTLSFNEKREPLVEAAYNAEQAEHETVLNEHESEQVAFGREEATLETEHAAFEIEQSEYEMDQADLETDHATHEIETEHATVHEIEQDATDETEKLEENMSLDELRNTQETDETEKLEENMSLDELRNTQETDETEKLEEIISLDELRNALENAVQEKEQAAIEEAKLSKPPQEDRVEELSEKVNNLWTKHMQYQSDSPYHGESKRTNTEALQVEDEIVVKMPPKQQTYRVARQRAALQQPYHPPINPRVRIPQPPFDGREHEYHTLAYNTPQTLLSEHPLIMCKKYAHSASFGAHFKRPFPPVYYTKPLLSFLRISRATRILCALQVGMFTAMLSKYQKQ